MATKIFSRFVLLALVLSACGPVVVIATPTVTIMPTVTATTTKTSTPTRTPSPTPTMTPTPVQIGDLVESLDVTLDLQGNVKETDEEVRWILQGIQAEQNYLCSNFKYCTFVQVHLIIGAKPMPGFSCTSDKARKEYVIWENPAQCSDGDLRRRSLASSAHEASHIYLQYEQGIDTPDERSIMQDDWLEGSAEWFGWHALMAAGLVDPMCQGPRHR